MINVWQRSVTRVILLSRQKSEPLPNHNGNFAQPSAPECDRLQCEAREPALRAHPELASKLGKR
jgi:hypothetical protein